MNNDIGWSCALALVGCFATGCSSSTNHRSSDAGWTGPDSAQTHMDGGSSAGEGGLTGIDGGTAVADGGTAMCCNKLTDNTNSCTGDAMVNDECTCLPVPAGTDCKAALPTDAGPIVTACSGYSCCFTFDGGSCQCISPGDLASCYGAGAACSAAASANGATLANSCP
jgi:hypothetical protein